MTEKFTGRVIFRNDEVIWRPKWFYLKPQDYFYGFTWKDLQKQHTFWDDEIKRVIVVKLNKREQEAIISK